MNLNIFSDTAKSLLCDYEESGLVDIRAVLYSLTRTKPVRTFTVKGQHETHCGYYTKPTQSALINALAIE